MTTNGKLYRAEAYSLNDEYTAIINAHAKATGKNRSAALRDILDKAAEAGIVEVEG